MGRYSSTKVYDGFSTVFRQWKADTTHCQYVHGYGVSFKIWFEGELDDRNWVWDFGAAKRSKTLIDGKTPKEWMAYMFDHTMIVAEDDPFRKAFEEMGTAGVAQVRILPAVGAEKFAEYVFDKLNEWVQAESEGRVKVAQVEFREHEKNSALYRP
jgi:6-pyruvoyltetrahydropterin/6-carboxytetrahydropterin synthase